MVGLEKKGGTSEQSAQRKELVAFHEAGHAIVGALMPDYDMVQKITIIPRSNGAGGLTFFSPADSRLESGLYSKQYMESQLAVALGGRLAEELVFGEDEVTTGASNDIQQVASIARRMVAQWGMSDLVGNVVVEEQQQGGPFMGREMGGGGPSWGGKVNMEIDIEVERLVNNSYLTAKKILSDNMDLLKELSNDLCERETVTAEEFQMLLVKFNAQTIDYKTIARTWIVRLCPSTNCLKRFK